MMGFNPQLETRALNQLVNFALGTDKDVGRAALAIYDLGGYGLSKAFPNAAYLTASDANFDENNLSTEHKVALNELVNAQDDLARFGPIAQSLLATLGPLLLKLILKRLGIDASDIVAMAPGANPVPDLADGTPGKRQDTSAPNPLPDNPNEDNKVAPLP